MKKSIYIVFCLAIFLVLAFAIADDNENETDSGKDKNATKNMTYGQCVSAAAKVKNTCYAEVKNASITCKENAGNSSQEVKLCQNDYKKDKTECKKSFKATKKNECAKIKHNFLETIGSSMK